MSARAARLRAWAVHLYTASAAVVALLALDAIVRERYAAAFAWLAVAMLIDCTDGTLARAWRIKAVLPHFDGAKLDDIMDYLTYVLVPVVLVLHADLLPPGAAGVAIAALPLIASAYGFCHSEAKTPDHFFTGFPSYWNVVALYLYVFDWPVIVNAAVLAVLSALVFVPIRYLYPSRARFARLPTYVAGAAWAVMVFALLAQFPNPSRELAWISLAFPAYYVALSLWLHWRGRGATRTQPAQTSA
ncbi:MAG: phosphatidylcholine/phosphatidylserine synthase [Candidatus Binatia bacterium]